MNELSVILSTYNSTEWLRKVLWGFSCQSFKDFEVIVADDGSTPETAALLDEMRAETGLEIGHVWQRDDGFRKCRILNKAIIHSKSEYLVFTDGDCIPHSNFLKTHASEAKPKRFISGSYFRLSLHASEALKREDIESGSCFQPKWLRARGMPFSKKMLRMAASPLQDRIMSPFTMRSCTLKGGNASVWRKDLIKANGLDERLGYGGEDRELGVRLRNAGVHPINARYKTTCLHLEHPRSYQDPAIVAANKELLRRTTREKVTRATTGIQQLLDSGYQAGG